jgi:hypothetical protein
LLCAIVVDELFWCFEGIFFFAGSCALQCDLVFDLVLDGGLIAFAFAHDVFENVLFAAWEGSYSTYVSIVDI